MSDTVILDGELSLTNQLDGQGGVYNRYNWRGYSAYEIAVQHGYTGTEEEWLASLQGEDGATGPQGPQGVQGVQGPKGDKGDTGDDYILTEQDKQEIAGLVDAPVDDVQINGTSILSDGVANIPVASGSVHGVVKTNSSYGTGMYGNAPKAIGLSKATDAEIKDSSNQYKPIVPYSQHTSTFYGLAKASGDTTQSRSSNAVGTYTDDAKASIQTMLGVPSSDDVVSDVQINGTSILNNGVANVPIATENNIGCVIVGTADNSYGIKRTSTGQLAISPALSAHIKAGTISGKPIAPQRQHESAFYGLAKAAGDTTQSQSSNEVGTYTEEAKTAIRTMLGLDKDSLVAEIRDALGL